jgi:hypothetical protein
VEHGELTISGRGEAVRTRLVLVRVDPRAVRVSLELGLSAEGAPRWRAGAVSRDVLAAVNAGQFGDRLPWGLVVLDGARLFPAGDGPLVTTVAVDSAGAVALTHGGLAAGAPRWAFQSYPTLLAGGVVPAALRGERRGLDVRHRDGRVALGLLHDGKVIVAMTRFDAFGEALGFVPLGLTTPEMAAVMGALGARDAVMLDGGISAQLMLRERDGRARVWPGVRAVPLALVVTALP